MKFLSLIVICCTSFKCIAQSLLANGSFEDLDGVCFVIGDSTHFGYQPITCIQPWGQYANTQMVMSKSQFVRSGVAAPVVKIYAPTGGKSNSVYGRSYLIAPFQQELKKDSLYELVFYYKLWYTCRYSSKNLGIVFLEDKQVKFNDYAPMFIESPYTLTSLPQADKWQRYTLTYRARGNERFLLIGNVDPTRKVKLKTVDRKQTSSSVQLLIDDISFVPLFATSKHMGSSAINLTLNDLVDSFQADSSYVLHHIFFRVNSAALLEVSQEQIDELLIYMRKYPSLNINITGHTDNLGTLEYNLELSQSRADAVKGKLIALGIAPHRIATAGVGSAKPIADNSDESGRSKNRRVEVMFNLRD
jgi:outer membrane protein OmpA-like peptidoglycan-associated protein